MSLYNLNAATPSFSAWEILSDLKKGKFILAKENH
jgi:hypothetical protein